MKVLFAAAECSPFFKTGGLGDVAGALPNALAKQGIEVAVVLPFFTGIPEKYKSQCQEVTHFYVNVGWRRQYCGIKKLILNNVTYFFIDNLYYFDRPSIYGFFDDGERFSYFSLAVIEMMEKVDFIPEVLHVNDHHTAIIPFLLKEKYRWIQAYEGIRTVLTIHNIEFQGSYAPGVLSDFFGMGQERFYDGAARFGDGVNFLKAGILYSDHVTTVSPSYAGEIQTAGFGAGLDGILRMEQFKLSGILNGIDIDANDPEKDPLIPYHFSIEHLEGKGKNKAALQKKAHLPIRPEIPVIGMVSRLTSQKGFHLVVDEMENLLQQDVQIVLLGTGDPNYEHAFRYFAERYPEKISATISFDVSYAQLIYAGSDLFLMPSAFEPCGLSQMIAMRYGTVPIVHEVGGLKDTVTPYNPIDRKGEGFGFQEFTSFYLMYAIQLALEIYRKEPENFRELIERGMKKDFSWKQSSRQYIELYQSLAE